MVPTLRMTGTLWPVMLLFLSAASSPSHAAPSVQTSISHAGVARIITTTGSQLPNLKRLTLTFLYASPIDLVDAIISCPVPSSAFGALLDTARQVLTVNVVAASSIAVADGAALVVIRIPLVSSEVPTDAMMLTAASCTDAEGKELTLTVGPVPVTRYRGVPSNQKVRSTRAVTLDGRLVRGGRSSPGVAIMHFGTDENVRSATRRYTCIGEK